MSDRSAPTAGRAGDRGPGRATDRGARVGGDAGRRDADTDRRGEDADRNEDDDPATDSVPEPTAETDASGDVAVGMYYPAAGTKEASGVAVYVREMADALSEFCPTYLYAEAEVGSTPLAESGAEVVSLSRAFDFDALRALDERLPGGPRSLPPRLRTPVGSASLVAGALRDGVIRHVDRNVDVLVTHGQLDTLLLSALTDVPVVRVFHACQRSGPGTKCVTALSNPDASVANSRQTADELAANLDHDVDGVVYPGVDVDAFAPDAEPAFERSEPVVTFVGRFTARKGVYDLVDAFAEVDEDARLELIGRGDTGRLRARLRERGIESAATIRESVPHDELPGYYAASDVVCLPSHYESFGLANLEAMACGVPVVTTDVPGVREYATDGETAVLAPPGDAERLAASLSTLLADPDRRERIGAAGRAAAERYSWENSAKRLAALAAAVSDRR